MYHKEMETEDPVEAWIWVDKGCKIVAANTEMRLVGLKCCAGKVQYGIEFSFPSLFFNSKLFIVIFFFWEFALDQDKQSAAL